MYASAAAWGIAGRSDCGGSDSGRASGPGGTRASRASSSRIDATSGGGAEGSSAGATVGPAEEAPFRSLALLSAGRLFFARGSSGAGLRAFAMVVLGTAADGGLFEESLSEHTGTPGVVESPVRPDSEGALRITALLCAGRQGPFPHASYRLGWPDRTMTAFSDPPLATRDPEIHALIRAEEVRETDKIRLIASENYVSRAVLEATGSILTNKYSEGYAGKRYYEGQQIIDQVEELAISRLKTLFGAEHVNVQPYSGSPANLAVYLAFCNAGDTILGLSLPAGGHLTHGWKVSITGKYFNSKGYGVRPDTHRIDFDEVRALAREHQPKLLWCGTSAYPRQLDFAAFRSIADEVGAILVADIAHIAGLVAGGAHPSPVAFADVVSTTTHKTLRGPRGGLVLCTDEFKEHVDRGCPLVLGGPLPHVMAAKA